MLRVLYISHTSEFHGSGKALHFIIQHMSQRGVEVIVILPSVEGGLYREFERMQIKSLVHNFTFFIWPSLNVLRDFLLLPLRLLKLLISILNSFIFLKKAVDEFKPDIIHTNVGVLHIGQYLSYRLKIPHVWHLREYQDLHYNWKPFPSNKLFLININQDNCYPVAITYGIFEHYKLWSNKNSTIIYDGVFNTDVIPTIKKSKSKYFLYVGTLSNEKGTLEVIETFSRVSKINPEFQLLLAGSGEVKYVNFLNHLVDCCEISSKVHFLGFRSDVYDLMSDAIALIVPSNFEGFGFITVEAMLNGCLVIGKNSAGTKEQFDNGLEYVGEEIGVRYNTVDELYLIMCSLCKENLSEYYSMLKNAQKAVIDLYSTKRNADKIMDLYLRIIKRNEK